MTSIVGKDNMKLSFNLAGMLLTLAIGIAVGALIFRDLPQTSAATDRLAAPTDTPPVNPVPDDTQHTGDAGYVGVIFARQSADIVARLEGSLQSISANLGDVREVVANTVIRAPFDGTVAARYLDAGAAVRSGTPIISLIRPDDLWVRFAIPETKRARLIIGGLVHFQLEGSTVSVPGTLEYVAPSIIADSQELLVEARLSVPAALQDQIRPGASGRVSGGTR